MELLNIAADQVALEGTQGITLTKLWFEVGQITRKLLTDTQKTRIISYLLNLPQYKCYYLNDARKLNILPPHSEPLILYGKCDRHYSTAETPFNAKLTVTSPETCPSIMDIGFCPERYSRVELEDMEASDILQYDPDRLTFVASFIDRITALLPPDLCIEEIQNETYSSWLMMEYLGKCRNRGAFISELRDDWAFGVDVYPIVNQLFKSGFIEKQVHDHNRLILLSRFVDKKMDSANEEKLPDCVVAFDKAFSDYRTVHPGATSVPKKFLIPYFKDVKQVKKNVEYMKFKGYCRTVYVKKGNKNKLGEDAFKAELERTYPCPKLTWTNGLGDTFSAISPEEIEPDHTMARLYRNCVTQAENTLRLFSFYTGCMHYTARGVDKKMSAIYCKSLSVKTVETRKTFVKVTSVVPEQSMQDVSFLSDAQPVHICSTPTPTKDEPQVLSSSIDETPPPSTPVSASKRSVSTAWKDYITHDLSEFGVILESDDFTFKHKFFRTDLQKLRRALILKYLAKVAVIESGPLASKVAEMETKMGMSNPPWDRKSRKRFLAILTSEGLIGQINAKYDRSGCEKEIHMVVLPHIDETHPLVYKLANDRATVRFNDGLKKLPETKMIATANTANVSGGGCTTKDNHVVNGHNGAVEDGASEDATENEGKKIIQEYEKKLAQSLNPQEMVENEDRAISLIDESWKPGADDSSDVVFGQLVPYMHCVKILHRILLYMVYGIHPDLSQKYIDHLNMFMLSPCVHGTGWIQYSDVMDMIPLKILGMIMEKNAYKARYKSLGSTLYTSFEPLGVAHPIIRSSIVTNDTIVSRVWCWVKILGSLGLMTFLKPEKLGERRRPGFVYVSRTAAFYDTCNPYDNGEANGPKRYNLAKFAFSDLITVNQYWSALTDICIDSVKTGLFAGIPVTAGIFSRKYRLLNNSSTVMDKLFVSKATDVGEFVTPKFETFGVAGTELKFDLQDPVHWYPMKKANAETRKLIRSENLMKRSCKKSALKLSKKIAEKAAASLMGRVSKAKTKKCDSANTGYNIRARTYPRLIAGNSNASVTRWKRGNEQTKKQQKINQEISNRKLTLRVVWSPEEDAVMIHAYVTLYTMRSLLRATLGCGFFIRDILHELLPHSAGSKNEYSINRRFRYLMNNDYKCMMQFFGLRVIAIKCNTICNIFKNSTNAALNEQELWRLFRKVYSFILMCNKNWPYVSAEWNREYIGNNFVIHPLFPPTATPLEWEIKNGSTVEKWKASLCDTILCMIMPYYFEKQHDPYSTPTVVLSKLLGVEHIASIMVTIFQRISAKILSFNSKQVRAYPEYGRFLALLKLDKVPQGCMKVFNYWLSKHPLSKSFVSIYEESDVINRASEKVVDQQEIVPWNSLNDDGQCFLLFSSFFSNDTPYFTLSVEMNAPLFEFPTIKATAELIEEETRRSRMKKNETQRPADSGSDHDEFPDQKMFPSFGNCNTCDDHPETIHGDEIIHGADETLHESSGVLLIKDDITLKNRQELNFRLAEYYRSFYAITMQDKDQKINHHIPNLSLSLHPQLQEKRGLCDLENVSCLYQILFKDVPQSKPTIISSVFDLVKLKTPTDFELLPGVPFYITTFSNSLDYKFEELSDHHKAVYASIHQQSHEGKSYSDLRKEMIHFSESGLLGILRDLITNGSVIVSGILHIRLCARGFCPFFTSLRTDEVVVAHQVPSGSSFTTIKFLPSAFVNWDGSFCANFFSTVLNWTIETLTYIPAVNFIELHDRISIYLCPVQFLRVVKLAETLHMLEIRIMKDDVICSHSFFEDEEVDDYSSIDVDLKHLYLYPLPDALVRVKTFCQKFQLKKQLAYIGPQRLSLYASLIDLFKTRRLFDPYLLYYD